MANSNVLEFKPKQEQEVETVLCPYCHGEIEDGVNFCKHCGHKLTKSTKQRYAPQKVQKKYPLKTVEQIDAMREYLLHGFSKKGEASKSNRRNEMIFTLGINIGFRASDLLRIKVSDIANKNYCYMVEKKTGKGRKVMLPDNVQEMLARYIEYMNLKNDDYLFQSNKGGTMNVRSLNDIISKAGIAIGYDKPLGSHSIRKTYGYQTYMAALKKGTGEAQRALAVLCELFGHSSEAITLAYIGIDEEEKEALATLTAKQYDLFKYYKDKNNDDDD